MIASKFGTPSVHTKPGRCQETRSWRERRRGAGPFGCWLFWGRLFGGTKVWQLDGWVGVKIKVCVFFFGCVCVLLDWLFACLIYIGWLIGFVWLLACLLAWLIDWLIDWLIGCWSIVCSVAWLLVFGGLARENTPIIWDAVQLHCSRWDHITGGNLGSQFPIGFPVVRDGHAPNGRCFIYTSIIRICYPQYKEFRPWHIWENYPK